MIRLDKIKIKFPISCINSINFERQRYTQTTPYRLSICSVTDRREEAITIEFTGKILLQNYFRLISRETIRECLENVNAHGVINMDPDTVINNSIVLLADFTKDVPLSSVPTISSIQTLKSVATLSVNNHHRYIVSDYRGQNGMMIKNAVASNRSAKRIIIYDKFYEMNKRENRAFLSSIGNREQMLEYFNGKIRFETNATSFKRLRTLLNLGDTKEPVSLFTLLNADANPLQNAMLEMFHPITHTEQPITTRNQDRLALLKLLQWDLRAVEENIREHARSSITRAMQPYRDLYAQHFHLNRDINIVDFVA